MSDFSYAIRLVRKDDRAGSIYGCVTEPSVFGNAATFWCGLYDGPLNMAICNLRLDRSSRDAKKFALFRAKSGWFGSLG